jgi:hypothetical protein
MKLFVYDKKMLHLLTSLHSKTDYLFLEVSEDTHTESEPDSTMQGVYPIHLRSFTDTAAEYHGCTDAEPAADCTLQQA